MISDIYFMPLGGGQRVGASCYFLRIGNANIILDAGIGKKNGLEFEPDFYSLVSTPFVQSMNQIGQIYISHAHMDHVGCLTKLMGCAGRSAVYMTEITKMLTEYQLYDRIYCSRSAGDPGSGRDSGEDSRLAVKSLLENIAAVSYMQTIDFGIYKASFFPAGHIPGAMMILFDTGKRKILYTGDYSLDPTLLTEGCKVPADTKIDTVILCGLHAKHPDYVKKSSSLFKKVNFVLENAESTGQPTACVVLQLSKGIEFLKALNEQNRRGIPIYIDRPLMGIIRKMEQLSIPIMNQHNKMIGESPPAGPHIFVTSDSGNRFLGGYRKIPVDFTLHEDFSDMKRFIKAVNPRQAVIVHCAKEYSVFDRTIEQEVMSDGDCRTQFIFAEERELYKL